MLPAIVRLPKPLHPARATSPAPDDHFLEQVDRNAGVAGEGAGQCGWASGERSAGVDYIQFVAGGALGILRLKE
jgi:hypothetical protein